MILRMSPQGFLVVTTYYREHYNVNYLRVVIMCNKTHVGNDLEVFADVQIILMLEFERGDIL